MSPEVRRFSRDGLRWYVRSQTLVGHFNTDALAMSVTTILKFLEEDTTGLERWQADHDGSGDTFHHEHIFWYSAPRGTLCHYQALKKFESACEEDDMWGDEESESMQMVMQGPEEGTFDDASHDLDDIVYSVLKNQAVVSSREEYEMLFEGNTRLVDVLHQDIEYFVEAFNDVCEELGVTEDSIIAIERFMLDTGLGLGGQCDMLYEDPNGNVVLADLKTSSSFRHKHRLQAVAYMKAVERDPDLPDEVDRLEIWRIDPDEPEWQVHSHVVPEHVEHLQKEDSTAVSKYTDEHFFKDKWGDFEYDSIEDMWETYEELTETAHDAGR